MCENRSRTTCSLALRIEPRTRSSRAAHSPLPTRWSPQHSAPEGCGHVHPCCRSCLCKRTPTLQKHWSKAAEQQHGGQKWKDAFTDTAPAESPWSLERSTPGSVVPEHPRSAKFVHVHPCCRLTPVRALQTTSPATISTISSMNHSTGTPTICSRICSLTMLGMTVRNGHQHHVNQMTTCESHDYL